MKKFNRLVIMAVMMAFLWCAPVSATISGNEVPEDLEGISIEVLTKEDTPVFTYGESKNLDLIIKNTGSKTIENLYFKPLASNDSAVYPFEINNNPVNMNISSLSPGAEASASIPFKTRNNVISGYRTINYTISFSCEVDGKQQELTFSESLSVNIHGNPEVDDPTASTEETTTSDPSEQNDIKISVGVNQSTPVCVYGQPVEITLTFLNNGGNTANGVVVTPIVDADSNIFPFEIQQMDYSRKIDTLLGTGLEQDANARMRSITYSLVTRKDVTSGYKKVSFQIDYYTDALIDKSITKDIYVMVQGNPELDAKAEEGETGDGKTSVPRVIVSGYTTVPEEIYAGDSFEITMSMTNTSKLTAVTNMVFDIQSEQFNIDQNSTAAAFLPVSGSSSVFVDRIGPGETQEISIEMTARTDLSPRPYVLNVKMNYEDTDKNPYEATASVSVPVKQQDKLEISTPEIMPESIDVGSQANIMFNIYNTGKTTLYNVMVRFSGDSIESTECFVGNVNPGATGAVDAMLTGIAATMDDGTLTAEITYENQSGEPMTVEKEYSLFVNEFAMMDDSMMDDMMNMDGMEEESSSTPAIIAIVVIVIAAAGIAAFIIMKKKKKKALELSESEGLDEI